MCAQKKSGSDALSNKWYLPLHVAPDLNKQNEGGCTVNPLQ